MPLAASPQTSEPDDARVIAEGRQQVCVGRHREEGETRMGLFPIGRC
jgi:hypothetical protein